MTTFPGKSMSMVRRQVFLKKNTFNLFLNINIILKYYNTTRLEK